MEPQTTPEISKQPTKISYPIIILIVLVVLLAIVSAWFGWQYKQLNSDNKQLQTQINSLNNQLTSNKKPSSTPSPITTPTTVITKALSDNVSAAISSKNTAALESYMAPSVNVVLAASEGMGPQSPNQAVKDLEYLNSATSPWNFSLPNTTLNIYKNNQYYGKYFGNNTIVGKSANGYVVAFGVNSSGKIDTIFMTVNEDLLTQ